MSGRVFCMGGRTGQRVGKRRERGQGGRVERERGREGGIEGGREQEL